MRKKSIGGSRIVVMPVFINLFFYQAALPVTSVTVFASGYSLTMLLRSHTHTRNTGSNISDHIGCCCLLSAPRGHTYAFTVVPPERLPPPPLQALNLPYLPSLISEKRPPLPTHLQTRCTSHPSPHTQRAVTPAATVGHPSFSYPILSPLAHVHAHPVATAFSCAPRHPCSYPCLRDIPWPPPA